MNNKHFDTAINERLLNSTWDQKIASAVITRVKKRNRLYTVSGSIAALVLLVVGVFLWQGSQYPANTTYSFVHAQTDGVFKNVFPEAQTTDLTYSYIDEHVTKIIDTALLER